MFSPDHRVLSWRARMWLGILGIVSITGLLATTGSANFPPACARARSAGASTSCTSRRAAAQLDRQGAALSRLAALVGTEAQRRMRMNAQAFESREE